MYGKQCSFGIASNQYFILLTSAKKTRQLMFSAFLSASLLVPFDSFAYLIIPDNFASTSVIPSNFQNSTILSITSTSEGNAWASSGAFLHNINFDNISSYTSTIPFANNNFVVEDLCSNTEGILNLLMLNYQGGGEIRQFTGTEYSTFAAFDSNQGFARAMALDGAGNSFVSGTYGNINDPGWIRGFNASGTPTFNVNVGISPVGLDFDSFGGAYVASFDGEIFALGETGDLSLLTQLAPGTGYIESFAINQEDDFFLGVNLGQAFGTNSSAIMRLGLNGEAEVLAYGVGDIPLDMTFGENGDLLLASFNPYSGSSVVRLSGNFSGSSGLSEEPPLAVSVPEPSTLALMGAGLVVLGFSRRKRKDN